MEAYKTDFELERNDRATAAGRYNEEEEQLKKTLQDLNEKLEKKVLEVNIVILCVCMRVYVRMYVHPCVLSCVCACMCMCVCYTNLGSYVGKSIIRVWKFV